MKNKIHYQLMVLTFLALSTLSSQLSTVFAQASQFFRIAGPAATKITAFQRNGTMVWSNAQPGATYTVQTVVALPGGSNWTDYVQIPATNGVNTNQLIIFNPPAGMAFIPAGLFTMGNSSGDPEINDAHTVLVNVSAFYMDTNLVSYTHWQSVYNWAAQHGYGFANSGVGKAANHPVQIVDWFDCLKWCNARSEQAGLQPVYYSDAGLTHVYTNAELPPYVNWAANGYRLPTEAEWEKAARGGLNGQRFPWGNVISESLANYYGAPGSWSYDLGPQGYNALYASGTWPYTSPVGSFAPNGYRLFDMAGNSVEWCWDWYAAPPYPAGSPYLGGSDPTGPASGSDRVVRGGAWLNTAIAATCAYRDYKDPSVGDYIGFRCVRGF